MPISPVYRSREITRDTCIRGFTGRQIVKSAVFDASTLVLQTLTNPVQYTNIYGSALQAVTAYFVPIGSFLTISSNDPTKVMVFGGPVAPVNDVQTVSTTGSPTGGTFTLQFTSAQTSAVPYQSTTTAIPYNATAAQLQAILQATPAIGYNNVTCTSGPLPGTGIVCTFNGILAGQPLNPMTVAANNLTGGSTPAPAVAHTTTGSVGQTIIGVYDGAPNRDFFYNVVAADEAVPIYFHSVSFDISKLQNWELYGELAEVALPTCTFF